MASAAAAAAPASAPAPAAAIPATKIGTHDGTFHADEACAIALLKMLPRYAQAVVTRTRDPKLLAAQDIVVDVGGVYDAARHRYDHHQREFQDTLLPNFHTRLSSAGLVYRHFGREIIHTLMPDLTNSELDTIYNRVYRNFVEALDGHDNGVNQYPADIAPAYVDNTTLPSRVSRLNPAWNEEGKVNVMERFERAMALTGGEFADAVHAAAKVWLPARNIVKDAVEKRFGVHKSGRIMLLTTYTAWNSHIYDAEKELKVVNGAEGNDVWYVLYQDTNKSWRVQCVPVSGGSFVSRKPMPAAWRGVRDDQLSGVTGIPGCVFCHATGFIGGNSTYDGALQMAVASIAADTAVNKPAEVKPKSAAKPAAAAAAAAGSTAPAS